MLGDLPTARAEGRKGFGTLGKCVLEFCNGQILLERRSEDNYSQSVETQLGQNEAIQAVNSPSRMPDHPKVWSRSIEGPMPTNDPFESPCCAWRWQG